MDTNIWLRYIRRFYPEDDPILCEQVETLLNVLDGKMTEVAMEGFLIFCSRLVDEYGNHRTEQLSEVFKTDSSFGKDSLLHSLEHLNKMVGGLHAYKKCYPVTIIPPKPAFPLLKIIGIDLIVKNVFRILDVNSKEFHTNEPIFDFIIKTGTLPKLPKQRHPVRRTKPRFHWCSYKKWGSPEETRSALQIYESWSACNLRALIKTSDIKNSAYMAFNGDIFDPSDNSLKFYKYYYEPIAQDHPKYIGGGIQIGVDGAPNVEALERWSDSKKRWELAWVNPKSI